MAHSFLLALSAVAICIASAATDILPYGVVSALLYLVRTLCHTLILIVLSAVAICIASAVTDILPYGVVSALL